MELVTICVDFWKINVTALSRMGRRRRVWTQRDVWRLDIVQLSMGRDPPSLEQLDREGNFKIALRVKRLHLWNT